MPKMARNKSVLHDVLAQGASNRDITGFFFFFITGPLLWNKRIATFELEEPETHSFSNQIYDINDRDIYYMKHWIMLAVTKR